MLLLLLGEEADRQTERQARGTAAATGYYVLGGGCVHCAVSSVTLAAAAAAAAAVEAHLLLRFRLMVILQN